MRGLLEVHAIGRDAAPTSSLKLKPVPALDMMRYQRLSPDCLPLANGGGSGGVARKPASRSFRDDEGPAVATDGSRLASYLAASQVDSKPARPRAPQPPSSSAARSPARDHGHHHPSDSSDTASPSSTGAGTGTGAVGGDVLLQWGHNKRSRCRRDSSAASLSASPSTQRRQTPGSGKIQRRASAPAPAEKLMMPPPPPATITRGSNLRSSSSFPPRAAGVDGNHSRSVEERSGGLHKRSSPDKPHNNKNASTLDHHMDSKNNQHHHHQHHNNNTDSPLLAANGTAAGEKLGGFELPRIFVSLSRKEKEDDFLVMKGTKLPQRPKKRAKNVDKSLQFVFPGMWLSDLTKGRYEVREKKCVKKV